MNYQNYYQYFSPTPAAIVLCCDRCNNAQWNLDSPYIKYCCSARLRRATTKEYTDACKAIKHVMKDHIMSTVDGHVPYVD